MTKFIFGLTLALFSFHSNSHATIKVGLILDKGGRDDKSFNSAAVAGSERAKKDFNIELNEIETMDDMQLENNFRNLANKKLDLILGIGFAQKEAMEKVAKKFPGVKFALVDSEINLPNVKSLMFEEHQGSYLVGYIAGKMSKTGKIGFVGGMEIPLIKRFELGFSEGIKRANPKANLISKYLGNDGSAWNNPAKGKQTALLMYSEGADIIFQAAGASGLGVFDAAEEKGKLAIGVDSNQNWIKPGKILTSMLKRVDVAVYETIKEVSEQKFMPGTKRFGLNNDGVGFAVDSNNEKLIDPALRKELESLKKDIISGKLKVSDYYLVSKSR